MDRRKKKSIQVINYLASKSPNSKINRLKLMKLLWLADRYHLLRYGRTILKDSYFAMEHGPVPTVTLNLSKHIDDYTNEYLIFTRYSIESKMSPDLTFFSETDINVLDKVLRDFEIYNQWDLCDISHEYPEWKRFEQALNDPTTPNSYSMEMVDFFMIPKDNGKNFSSFFEISEEIIFESKQIFHSRKRFELNSSKR
ncbi:MAG: Panacea domain-containing protein [Flavobacteriales bacterium]|nr:Panacea domain-containing protein [Flavobacteriales bacterium]MCW8912903.1 Panacea domain-containing protein [Flavobacteriales bacterium]MCW8937252.1 Panacea domain-containing protein [Flavobacteriales bacterium]MCW8941005.1 Panacea domain-containing protein [Flavobacteriales bacterium]MCW8967787.1 Panacea domain-containing protein [Flavobacteriales bacterium]